MEDIGLFKQGWKWFQSQKHTYSRARTAFFSFRDKVGMFIERHWPTVCRGCAWMGSLLRLVVLQWWDCIIKGFRSLIGLGSAALLLIMWSFFLSLTSMSCLVYVLLSMVYSSLIPDKKFFYVILGYFRIRIWMLLEMITRFMKLSSQRQQLVK